MGAALLGMSKNDKMIIGVPTGERVSILVGNIIREVLK